MPENYEINGVNYKPISAWGYVGYMLLFSIPLIGTILLIVFACGGTSKINLKNYARSYLLMLLLAIILLVILIAMSVFLGFDLNLAF